ncbi:MAG TPA: YbgF trimerization domain-containing protein, partial [Anaerolineae bacterium]|nr:YbgF trimerization domain-containing protein [Anaerolineae bacterium]
MRRIIPLLLLALCGSAQAAFFTDDEARRGVAELKQQVVGLQGKLDDANAARQALEKRLADLDAATKAQAVDMLGQIDRLNAEISNLRGQLEVNNHDIGLSQQRQRDLYTDLDARLRKLEGGAVAAAQTADAAASTNATAAPTTAVPATTPAPTTAAPATTPAPTAVDAAAELKTYEAAHDLFKAGKYKESADAFEKFLVTYPNSKYAPSAQYWVGYANFSQKNYKAA